MTKIMFWPSPCYYTWELSKEHNHYSNHLLTFAIWDDVFTIVLIYWWFWIMYLLSQMMYLLSRMMSFMWIAKKEKKKEYYIGSSTDYFVEMVTEQKKLMSVKIEYDLKREICLHSTNIGIWKLSESKLVGSDQFVSFVGNLSSEKFETMHPLKSK